MLGMNGLLFGVLIMLAGFVAYFVSDKLKLLRAKPVMPKKAEEFETA